MATILLLKKNLKEYEEWRLTQWQIRNTDHTLHYSFWQTICPSRTSANVNPSDPNPTSLSRLTMISTKLSPSMVFSSTIACLDLLQHSPHALLSFLDDHIRIRDKLQIRDNAALGTPSSIASSRLSLTTLPQKGDLVPTSSSHSLIICKKRRGKWLITLHGGFTHS